MDHTWRHQILADVDSTYAAAVDASTVAILQSTAPGASAEDSRQVVDGMRTGSIFAGVHDPNVRATLLANLLCLPGLVPSIHTVFEGLKQLEPACAVMKQLAGGHGISIREAMWGAFQPTAWGPVERGEGIIAEGRWADEAAQRWFAYVQLWVFCLRHFPLLTSFAPRKDASRPTTAARRPVEALQHRLGKLAVESGFGTAEAQRWAHRDPAAALAQRFCDEVRLAMGEPEDGLCARLHKVLASADRRAPSANEAKAPAFFGTIDLPRHRRTGRPFAAEFEVDRRELFLAGLLLPPDLEAARRHGYDRLAVAFVRRDLIDSFFGRDGVDLGRMGPDEVRTQPPPPEPNRGPQPGDGAAAIASSPVLSVSQVPRVPPVDASQPMSGSIVALSTMIEAVEDDDDDGVLAVEAVNAAHRDGPWSVETDAHPVTIDQVMEDAAFPTLTAEAYHMMAQRRRPPDKDGAYGLTGEQRALARVRTLRGQLERQAQQLEDLKQQNRHLVSDAEESRRELEQLRAAHLDTLSRGDPSTHDATSSELGSSGSPPVGLLASEETSRLELDRLRQAMTHAPTRRPSGAAAPFITVVLQRATNNKETFVFGRDLVHHLVDSLGPTADGSRLVVRLDGLMPPASAGANMQELLQRARLVEITMGFPAPKRPIPTGPLARVSPLDVDARHRTPTKRARLEPAVDAVEGRIQELGDDEEL